MDMNRSDSGLGAFVYAAAWLSNRFDLEVLSFGRAGDAPSQSCKLEMCGPFLAYDITLDSTWIFVSASVMDRSDPPQRLATFPDVRQGWQDTCKLITALERNKVRSLEVPLEIGDGGPNSFVIGD
jgi:hypothetical protein